MTWWCSASKEAWSWSYKAYPGIWLAIALLVGSYVVLALRHRRAVGTTSEDRRKFMWFGLGAAVLWLATDWPLGTLGASYLATAHMTQYMLYTLAAAPLILLGIPEWMARPTLERLRLMRVVRWLAHPLIAGVSFNLILLGSHAPFTVDTFRVNQFGSMILDLLWLLSGFILWSVLISPLPELRHPSPAVKCVYLFLAAGAIPMAPGGFLTFADFPLYRTYELAPRVADFTASADQQMAGIIMKIGGVPVIWTVIFIIFVRWAMIDRDAAAALGQPIPDDVSAISTNGDTDGDALPSLRDASLPSAAVPSHHSTTDDRSGG